MFQLNWKEKSFLVGMGGALGGCRALSHSTVASIGSFLPVGRMSSMEALSHDAFMIGLDMESAIIQIEKKNPGLTANERD